MFVLHSKSHGYLVNAVPHLQTTSSILSARLFDSLESIQKVTKAINKQRVFWFLNIDWTAQAITQEEYFKLALQKNDRKPGPFIPCPNYEDDWYAYRRRYKV